MQLTGEHHLPAPRERVWAALLDAPTLRAAIPGCEAIEADGPGRYRVTVLAAVGPVRARFKGRLQQQDLQPPQRYTLSFEGDGGLAGFARGSAEVELAEARVDGPAGAATGTRLSYTAQAQVGGRMAQIGGRLIDATAARLSAEFFERLAQVIGPQAAPAAGLAASTTQATVPAPSSAAANALVGLPMGAAPNTARSVEAERGHVSIQMPAWVWVYTVTVFALLLGWVAAR